MDNPSQEKIISDSESLGTWSTENSDSQDSINSWMTDSSCESCSEEEFWNEAK